MPGSLITKNALAAAMRELMQQEHFQKISIGDICARCGMSRKSFYYHFRDKYDLVNWVFYTDLVNLVREKEKASYGAYEFFEDLAGYFYENRAYYVNAFSVEGQNCFAEYFAEILQPIAQTYLRQAMADDSESEFLAVFFTDAIRVSIIRWLREQKELGPKEYVALLRRAMQGVVYYGSGEAARKTAAPEEGGGQAGD